MDPITQELPRNFAAFKEGRNPPEKEATASAPAKGEKAEKPLVPETSKPSETAGDSETPKPQEQPKRHDADDRVRILTKRQKEMEEKHDKELRERDEKHERELAEIRKLLVTKVAAPSEPQPKTEAAPAPTAPANTGEPDWDQFLANTPKDEPLGKTITRFNREHIAWLNAQNRQTEQQRTVEQTRQSAINKAREKHGAEAVDAALGSKENPTSGVALAQGVISFLAQYDNWVDVLVHLQQNPAEYRRIFAMPPQQQLGEVVFLARTLGAAPAKDDEQPPLEKPKPTAPPTSRIPAPMRVIGGTEASAPKTTTDAPNFRSFKKVSGYGNRRGK